MEFDELVKELEKLLWVKIDRLNKERLLELLKKYKNRF
jgi:hypothetical protein